MKINKYLLGMVMVSAAAVGFTSCNDDDPLVTLDPVEKVEGEQGGESTLKVPEEVVKVKIGNDIAVPAEGARGTVNAYSLNENVVKIADSGNGPMIQGVKNGTAEIMVSDDSGSYKKFTVSVYTTDVMQLSHTAYDFETPLGSSATTTECHVVLGNGEYTIVSDNPKVYASINSETGEISMTAKSASENYVANVTVRDISNLEATIAVTVKATFDPFTNQDIQRIMKLTANEIWADCPEITSSNVPMYYQWYESSGTWSNSDADGVHTLGWAYRTYGSILIKYPTGTAVGQEVNGSFTYCYSSWGGTGNYDGKAKVLVDNAERTIAIAWYVDLENERINRAYVVHNK